MSTASSPYSSPPYTTTPSPANTTTSTRTSDESGEPKEFSLDGIPRSASFTQLPATTPPDASFERSGIKRNFSENVLANPKANNFRHTSIKRASPYGDGAPDLGVYTELSRNVSTDSKVEPKITISKFTLDTDGNNTELAYGPKAMRQSVNGDAAKKTRSVSGSISRLTRQSWIAPSRSPSPGKRAVLEPKAVSPDAGSNAQEDDPRTSAAAISASPVDNGSAKSQPERRTVQRTKTRRPLSSLISRTPSVPPIPKSFSTDRLPLSHAHTSAETPPSLPKSKSFERLQGHGTESPRRKDELWGAFRTLEGDFQKFYSKHSSSKCAIVRTSLLPFLRAHAEPLPNFTLRPEDLDHRVNVLNKWWTGLLEMLNGRHGESVSGGDRPIVLDAVTAIMTRSEWSLTPSTSLLRSSRPSLKSKSTTSLGSNMSDFLAESVVHNVRNAYVQNLLSQMTFVVEKMSARSVPASLVAFCGKAVAHAFFYCDGTAEILVRLWSLSPRAIKRASAANDVKRGEDLRPVAEKLMGRFPPHLRNLAFSSLLTMARHLRTPPQVSIAISYIDWNGPWTGRWAGRDTDLFFSFTKSYYDLLSQYMPDDISQKERFCAPGYALVQAQLLTLLNTTVQRTNGQPTIDPFRGPSLDDPMSETDVSAAVLPTSPMSMYRSMAENRVIMLLRDCLSSSAAIAPRAQELFAESFQSLVKATAGQTSRFDHLSCFTLCDFLEEALIILVRYYQSPDTRLSTLDWAFWFEVLKLMMESNNSMTEIRVCAFLYSLWGTITSDSTRRRELCIDWLLSEETFERHFNHWCPMVRAFYMRLLVWRVARLDSTPCIDDANILAELSSRLNTVWRHLLWLQDSAQKQDRFPPSTAPCSPAPSRCLFIVKNDQPTSPGLFLSFDSILSSSSNTSPPASTEPSSLLTSPHIAPAPEKVAGGGKRRWGMLKSILPFGISSSSPSNSRSPAFGKSSGQNFPSANGHAIQPNTPQKPIPYRSHSFKFSLEFLENGRKSSKDRQLSPPKLPAPAQLFLDSSQFPVGEMTPLEPTGVATGPSKYAGKALAEWALLVAECHHFFERRKAEGVPDDSKVETPTLSVEPFRRPG